MSSTLTAWKFDGFLDPTILHVIFAADLSKTNLHVQCGSHNRFMSSGNLGSLAACGRYLLGTCRGCKDLVPR